jgi:uncharacterized protein YkwD
MIVNRGKGPIALALTSVAALCLVAVGAPTTAAPGQATTSISATVSATGTFARTNTYTWTLSQQTVSPTSAQFTLGSTQKFTHTLTARRTLSQMDTGFGVNGQVCVTNGGSVATDSLIVAVQLQSQVGGGYQDLGSAQTLTDLTNPPVIPARQTQCFPYNILFTPTPGASYRVAATVTIMNHSGSQTSGPSPKSASFTLTSPTTTTNIDDQATVTDVLQTPICSGFTTQDTLASPSAVSVGSNGSATLTFTVRVTNASSTGAAGCPLMDTVTLTTNGTGTQISAPATVTLSSVAPCNQTQLLNSCLQDERLLQAFVFPQTGSNGQAASFVQDLFNKINQVRASVSTKKNPVPPLVRIEPLENAAQGYSQTLMTMQTDPGMLSHTLDGDPTSRAIAAGYNPTSVGENLAAGQWSAQEVINAWVNSPEHYANLINPNFTQVGLGLAGGPASDGEPFVLYWVADFGSSTVTNYPTVGGGAGPPIDVRSAVAQLHSYLQMADAAICAGDVNGVAADLGAGGFVDFWNSQQLGLYNPALTTDTKNCLIGVLGFYYAATSANYTITTSYVSTQFILGG